MKIINTGYFYFGTDGTAYRGKVILNKREFDYIKKNIFKSKKASSYITKEALLPVCALGVSATDYIVSKFKNKSRYNYKRQNYIIEVR